MSNLNPWTIEDMKENASNWSLAGDAHLLEFLESFSEELLSKAEQTNENLNKLMGNLNNTSLSLDMAKRKFFSLHNTQFVESRVYEDDYSDAAATQEQKVEDKSTEDDKDIDWKDAICDGIAVVNNYFERVEVPGSDGEDETDFSCYILKPKDLYADRHLPYVIGSDEWHTKGPGLLDSSSEGEEENFIEELIDSSLDDQSINNQSKFAEDNESLSDILHNVTSKLPVANSTFEDNSEFFGSNNSEENNNSVPIQAPASTNSFALELARKLGNVIEQNPKIEEAEVNRKPIQNYTPNRVVGNLFDDEPPPLDVEDDLFGKSSQKGLFSEGAGLFDDIYNNDSWNKDKNALVKEQEKSKVSKQKLPDLFDDEYDDLFGSTSKKADTGAVVKPEQSHVKKTSIGNLFDDASLDDDDLFKDTITNPYKKSYLTPKGSNTVPYYDSEPPELNGPNSSVAESKQADKKPVGGVKIFGDADLFGQPKFDDLKTTLQHSKKTVNVSDINIEKDIPSKVPSNDLFDDFHNGSINSQNVIKTGEKKNSDTVSEALSENADKDKLNVSTKPQTKTLYLFDDDDDIFGDDLFSNISVKKFTSDLFSDEVVSDNLFAQDIKKSLHEDLSFSSSKKTSLANNNLNNDTAKSQDKDFRVDSPQFVLKTELSSTDLSTNKILENIVPEDEPVDKPDITDNITQNKNLSINIDLFDDNPPDLDDGWDSKSDNLFDDNENLFDSTSLVTGQRSGLFDDEPPSLFSESSGIVRDMSTRVETDDSFNPYASSSRRYSADIFSEQQSNDSFFVTKNRSNSEYRTQSNLGIIPEDISNIESSSTTEVTASGNITSLYNDSTFDYDFQQSSIEDDLFSQDASNIKPLPKSTLENSVASKNPLEDLFSSSRVNILNDQENGQQNMDDTEIFQSTILEKKSTTSSIFEDFDSGIFSIKSNQPKEVLSGASSIHAEFPSDSYMNITDQSKQTYGKPSKLEDSKNPEDAFASKIGSPGKLKLNLNINVSALKPGSGIISSRDLHRRISSEPEVPTETITNDTETVKKEDQATTLPETANLSENEAQVLSNITKDRAKIPVRRRPSSRKARKEAIRNSIADFRIHTLPDILSKEANPSLDKPTEEISTISDADNILAKKLSETNDNDMFKPIQMDSEHTRRNSFTSSSLFDEPEDFDDLFSELKLHSKSSTVKQSLFDDDDDDDLFGNVTGLHTKTKNDSNTSKVEIKKPPKVAQITKLKNTSVTDDPLSLFQE